MRHMVRCIIDITSVTGTNLSGSSPAPLSNKEFHAKASGQIGSKVAAWIFASSPSSSFGNLLPKNSFMNVSTAGTLHASKSGFGWSLIRASCSSFVRHRFILFSK